MRVRVSRGLAGIAIVALVAAACSSGVEAPDNSSTTTTAGPAATTTTPTTEGSSDTGFEYRIAIFEDLTTDNYWAYMDPESSVWNGYVFGNQAPGLFRFASPTLQLVPQVASGLPVQPIADGDGWTITQPILPGLTWSDGVELTTADLVFTYETVRGLGLGGNWLTSLPIGTADDPATEDDEFNPGVVSATAIDDHTIEYRFNTKPGLSLWQFGVGLAPILPQHHWSDAVTASATPADLYAVSGLEAPGMWAYDFVETEAGAFARNSANNAYPFRGSHTTLYENGTYSFTAPEAAIDETYYGEPGGPVSFEYDERVAAATVTYSIYGSQDTAVLALANGEVDFMLSSLGLQRGLQQLVLAEPDLDVVVNPANSYRYLAFNTRKFPMNDVAFRRALGCMIDKEFMANNVLQGAAIPAWSQVPEGNAFWFNPDAPRWCEGLSHQERVEEAVATLDSAGYTWTTKPVWDESNRDVLPKGEGLRGPDGTEVPELTLVAPGPGYDPLRATYSLFIEDWAQDLGIPLKAEPTGFNVIVDLITSSSADFDMYILGWSLTPFPNHLSAFFDSAADSTLGGNNYPGYVSSDFDELSDRFKESTDVDEARDLIRKMDAILAEDLPYVVLFTTPIIEPYRTTLRFPFTDNLSGLQNVQGLPSYVTLVE